MYVYIRLTYTNDKCVTQIYLIRKKKVKLRNSLTKWLSTVHVAQNYRGKIGNLSKVGSWNLSSFI